MSSANNPKVQALRAIPASTLLDAIRHPAAILESSGAVIAVNASFTSLFGYTPEAIEGKNIQDTLDLRHQGLMEASAPPHAANHLISWALASDEGAGCRSTPLRFSSPSNRREELPLRGLVRGRQ